jgi:hypothetical protein
MHACRGENSHAPRRRPHAYVEILCKTGTKRDRSTRKRQRDADPADGCNASLAVGNS